MNKIFIYFCSLFFVFNCFSQEINLTEVDRLISTTRHDLIQQSDNNPKVIKMYDDTVKLWRDFYVETEGKFDISLLLNAVQFAAKEHKGQFRKDADKTPYIVHPIGVSRSLFEEGQIRSINVLVAAILHDTLEDTNATPEQLERLFNSRVRYIVEEVTNDPNLSAEENKKRQIEHAPLMSLDAKLVKLADRLYNVRDLHNLPEENKEMVKRYLPWGEKMLKVLFGTNHYLEEALELELRSFTLLD